MNNDVDRRVLVADAIASAGVERLSREVEVNVEPGIEHEEILRVVGDYHGLVVRNRTQVTAELVAASSKMMVIGRAGVGVDNIDLDACRQRGIIVVNSPLATSVSVGEFTFGIMLSLARRISFADAQMKEGKWLKQELHGVELKGKVLGIIGVGRIGTEVARLAAAFGMRVIASDPYLSKEEMLARNVERVSLGRVFAESEFISIHTPLNSETHHIIDAEAISAMRDGVRIICAARGGVVDEAALLAGLESKKVSGAALDVFETEPTGLSALVEHPQVIVSPHIGAQTMEAQVRVGLDVADEVLAALRGEELRWRVV